MSGLSLAVAPRDPPPAAADRRRRGLGEEGEEGRRQQQQQQQQQQTVMGGVMGSLRVIELQLVAFIMVFSASGLVPLVDLLFPAFATLYVLLLSRLAFPPPPAPRETFSSGEIFRGSAWFRAYVVVGTAVGLFLPLAYVLGGFARSDDHAVRSATPHLFLLSCQILTENLISGLRIFSPPVRALVPTLYTVRRVFVVVDWLYDVWVNKTLPAAASAQDVAWMWFGRSLAIANLTYFSFNLFGFLIPQFLPRAFEKYFKERDEAEVVAKAAEDKRARDNAPANKPSPDDAKKVQ